MAVDASIRRQGWDRVTPVGAFYYMVQSGKQFRRDRQTSLLIIDAPQYLVEQGIKKGTAVAYNTFVESRYYERWRHSTLHKLTHHGWEHLLLSFEHAIIHLPENIDHVAKWVKYTHQKLPEGQLKQWVGLQVEKYEGCKELECIQGAAKRGESLFHLFSYLDPTEVSSAVVLVMQDVQDLTREISPFIRLRKRFYDELGRVHHTIVDKTHGSPQKKYNPFSRYSSPIIHKTAEQIIPKEIALQRIQKLAEDFETVCHCAEESTLHVLLPEAIEQGTQKVGWFVGRHIIRWYICDITGWAFAYTVQSTMHLAGYEEDEIIEHETLITTHWYAKWILWSVMLNLEVKTWKTNRANAHRQLQDAAHKYVGGIRNRIANSIEKHEERLGPIAKHVIPIIRGHVEREDDIHPTPAPSIWRQGWSYITSMWNSIIHPHQE